MSKIMKSSSLIVVLFKFIFEILARSDVMFAISYIDNKIDKNL